MACSPVVGRQLDQNDFTDIRLNHSDSTIHVPYVHVEFSKVLSHAAG